MIFYLYRALWFVLYFHTCACKIINDHRKLTVPDKIVSLTQGDKGFVNKLSLIANNQENQDPNTGYQNLTHYYSNRYHLVAVWWPSSHISATDFFLSFFDSPLDETPFLHLTALLPLEAESHPASLNDLGYLPGP